MHTAHGVKLRGLTPTTVARRCRDIVGRLDKPGELARYLDTMRRNYAEQDELARLFPFRAGQCRDEPYLFGHFPELHDRISATPGSFADSTRLFRQRSSSLPRPPLTIGVTRHNFFCLGEILGYAFQLQGIPRERTAALSVFPLARLIRSFLEYATALKTQAGAGAVEFVLCDPGLIEFLQLVQFHAQRGKVSEKGLARLVGVIAEHAFTGPETIVIDPVHRCNINCRHCFVHNPAIAHPPEFLERQFDLGMFRRIIDDARELGTERIILQGDGEPLLCDQFFPMLEYARAKGIAVSFFTNGTLLGRQEARRVVELGVEEVYCSLPAGTAETYQRVTATGTGQTFGAVTRNLEQLVSIKRTSGMRRPRLVMTHVIHSLNYHELTAMARLDCRIGADAARFYLIRLDEHNRTLKLTEEMLARIRRDLAPAAAIFKGSRVDFIDNIAFQLDHLEPPTGAWAKDVFLSQGCAIGWYFCLIPARYDVSLCCHLRTVGYLNGTPFKELWHSRQYATYRAAAKFLKDNRDLVFPNGVRLYDEHCEQCDNHQTLIAIAVELRKLGFDRFYTFRCR